MDQSVLINIRFRVVKDGPMNKEEDVHSGTIRNETDLNIVCNKDIKY